MVWWAPARVVAQAAEATAARRHPLRTHPQRVAEPLPAVVAAELLRSLAGPGPKPAPSLAEMRAELSGLLRDMKAKSEEQRVAFLLHDSPVRGAGQDARAGPGSALRHRHRQHHRAHRRGEARGSSPLGPTASRGTEADHRALCRAGLWPRPAAAPEAPVPAALQADAGATSCGRRLRTALLRALALDRAPGPLRRARPRQERGRRRDRNRRWARAGGDRAPLRRHRGPAFRRRVGRQRGRVPAHRRQQGRPREPGRVSSGRSARTPSASRAGIPPTVRRCPRGRSTSGARTRAA